MADEEKAERSYYAIIPASVRYDNNIPSAAKLLYGEITALCNEKGYCWASNGYFAKLYGVSTKSVSRWISELKSNGYIVVDIEHKKGSKEIEKRYIRISDDLWTKMSIPMDKNVHTPMDKNVQENNKDKNNTNYTDNIKSKIGEIVLYLNDVTGRQYRATNAHAQRHISARLSEGYSVEDFKTVINKKYNEWKGTDYEKYLRPETLFGTKFDSYLNQVEKKKYIVYHDDLEGIF